MIEVVSATNSTVLITGESGTGKELVAKAIHLNSPRAEEAFVSVNCGAFTETLLESELFGYMRGAFTGAAANKKGLFEVADKGTIFLDEIGDTSPAMQVKLLRVLQERMIRRVGGTEEIPVDVRVIAATNRDLTAMVAENQFREDLFYRISVIPLELPPLRHRRDDIPLLADHFLARLNCVHGKEDRSHFRRSAEKDRKLRLARQRPRTRKRDGAALSFWKPPTNCPRSICRRVSRRISQCARSPIFRRKDSIWNRMSRTFRRGTWKRRSAARTACRSRRRNCCECPTVRSGITCRSTTFRRRGGVAQPRVPDRAQPEDAKRKPDRAQPEDAKRKPDRAQPQEMARRGGRSHCNVSA